MNQDQSLKKLGGNNTATAPLLTHADLIYILKNGQMTIKDPTLAQTEAIIQAIMSEETFLINDYISSSKKKSLGAHVALENALRIVIQTGKKSLPQILDWIQRSIERPLCEPYLLLVLNEL